MDDWILRLILFSAAVNGLIVLHAPQESVGVIVMRTVLIVVLAFALIPKEPR